MSCTTMLGLREAETVELEEFRNAWGSAMRVWNSIAAAHWPGGRFPLSPSADFDGFWKLYEDPRLSRCERAALAWTFDRALCQVERAGELAALLREFDREHPVPSGVNHLPAIAEALERQGANEEYVAFAWVQTSVSGDVWEVQDRCPDRFHDEGAEDDYCPECGNERDDRRFWRTFVWSKDKDRGEHYFIFNEQGEIGAWS